MRRDLSVTRGVTSGLIGLRLAGLEVWLDARQSGVALTLPECYASFRVEGAANGGLWLQVRDGPLLSTEGWELLFRDGDSWQLWRDADGRRIFVPPRHSPLPRQIAVDAGFQTGEVVGEFGAGLLGRRAVYPLQDMDMRVYVNWLAETGDLIVHAAGVDDAGHGYAFVGPSGAGKSTLVTTVLSRAAAAEAATADSSTPVVLGEDQVIVRYQEGRFLLYGTPWHTNPARCSPGGVPLKKLFFLDQAIGHGVESCGPRVGVERLLQNALVPYYNHPGVERILDRLPRLAEQVPCYTLGFELGADALKLIREA